MAFWSEALRWMRGEQKEALTTSEAIWRHLYGGAETASGVTVTKESAMRLSTVYTCIGIIGETLGAEDAYAIGRGFATLLRRAGGSATDAAGNSSSCSFDVIVVDTTAPSMRVEKVQSPS